MQCLLSACREPFWPEQQCWVETPEPATGRPESGRMCLRCVFCSCALQFPLTSFPAASAHGMWRAAVRVQSCSRRPFYPDVDRCTVLPPLCPPPCILPVPSSLEPHLYPPPCVCFALGLCVCCLVLRVQIPTGPLIFNPLQQPQLSQFSPQQSQSATSSPQQQGETVRHTFTFTHIGPKGRRGHVLSC